MLAKCCQRLFSVSKSVPIVDVQGFLTQTDSSVKECEQVAKALHDYGCLIIKDPRVQPKDNDKFLDMMEKFYVRSSKNYYDGKPTDIFPETHYQVGATPEFKEQAKDHSEVIRKYGKGHEARTPQPPGFDAKWRYFWRIGDLTEEQKQKKVHHVPEGFPEWTETMNKWGQHMVNGCFTVAEMAAIGLGLNRNTFTKRMERGPHLLAPTGSDLTRYKKDTVFAGFHYGKTTCYSDFNFLTIHGKSRFPGLFAWLRTGERINVSVPEGHLLLQSGKQFEILTGGYVTCGYHEVIYTDLVEKARDKAIKEGRIPWRVSSTLFSHIRGDVMLEPLGKFATAEAKQKYKPILASDHALEELKDIKLAA